MPKSIQSSVSISSYQSLDGSNFTTAGFDLKHKSGFGAYVGIGTAFNGNNVGVFDLKESNKYKEGGILGHNARIRTKTLGETSTTQLRISPLTVDVPLNDGKTTLYANPHYVGLYNYETKNWTNSAGIFVGATRKIRDDATLSIEVQRYNLQDLSDNSGKNWSVNANLSIKF